MEDLMIKKLITLFKLGRKVAKSDILNIALIAKGGSWNFDTVLSISDLAIFRPRLKRLINFLIIRFSIQYV